MLSRNYNQMNNIYNMNGGMYNYNNPFCGGNMFSGLFGGTNSIFSFGNMFGGNMFGANMFGSIFGGNMFGNGCSMFTNCNGTMNYDAMAGWGVAGMLLNVAGMAIGDAIQGKRENSIENIDADIDALYEQKQDILDRVGKTEDEIMNFDISKTDEHTAYEQALEAYNNNEATITNTTDAEAKKAEPYTTAIANRSKLKNAMLDAKRDMDALETKMKQAKRDLEDINDKIRNAEALLNERIADKADGNRWTRNSDFLPATVNKQDYKDFKKADVKELIYKFTQLDDGEDKFTYAQALYNLDDATFIDVMDGDSNARTVRRWAKDYYEEHKDENGNYKAS